MACARCLTTGRAPARRTWARAAMRTATSEDLVALDEQLAIDCRDAPLHQVICDALRDRSVAPVEAANWLTTLMDHRNQQLTACLNLSCQV